MFNMGKTNINNNCINFEWFGYLIIGFHSIIPVEFFKDKQIGVRIFNSIFSGSKIDYNDIDLFVKKLIKDNTNDSDDDNVKKIKQYLYDILYEKHINFYDKNKKNISDVKASFINYFEKLLFHWSSLKTIKKDQKYQIIFEEKDYSFLPMSHTCFYQLVLDPKIKDKKDLFDRLKIAIYGSERGIGIC